MLSRNPNGFGTLGPHCARFRLFTDLSYTWPQGFLNGSERYRPPSTTVSQSISRRPANDHSSDRADVEAARGPGARTPWRWTSGHGVQAAPGLPRGLKLLGSGAARRKARGAGGKSLARSAARKAYAAIHNAPW